MAEDVAGGVAGGVAVGRVLGISAVRQWRGSMNDI